MNRSLPRVLRTLLAALLASAAGSAGAVGAIDPAAIAGVYKHRFANGDVSGDKYVSEDVLELVPVSPTGVYVKTHLEFYNGHQCAIAGVADVDGDALVYTDRSDLASDARCVLTLRVSATRLTFEDPGGACRLMYCGARGSFDGHAVDRTARRTIRYLKLLKGSADYRRALAEHDAAAGPPPSGH